jgi:CRP-like cAMP-binding protein
MQTAKSQHAMGLHRVEERLARWLLMTQDRIQARQPPLTQEFLRQMLGARRSSVTVAAALVKRQLEDGKAKQTGKPVRAKLNLLAARALFHRDGVDVCYE